METGISYYGNRILKHVREDMRSIKKNNCTYVVHTFSEEDLHFYQKTMHEIVEATHEAGLKVHMDPWAVGGIFGGEAFSRFVMENKDACQIDNKGGYLAKACPNHPGFRDYLKDWTERALEFEPDFIFWDEPHYPMFAEQEKRWACCCPVCRKRYYEEHQKEMGDVLTEELILFYQGSVISLIKELALLVKKAGVKNSICFLPRERYNFATYMWEKYAQLDSLDMIGTDPYWTVLKEDVDDCVPRLSRRIQDLCSKYDKEGQIWIQNIYIPSGKEREVGRAVDLAYKEGIRNIAAWCFHGGSMLGSKARSGRPEKVWEILGMKYGELLRMNKK